MVKFGAVHSYIAITWTEEDLEACADLNLPCADVQSMLVEPLSERQRSTQAAPDAADRLCQIIADWSQRTVGWTTMHACTPHAWGKCAPHQQHRAYV